MIHDIHIKKFLFCLFVLNNPEADKGLSIIALLGSVEISVDIVELNKKQIDSSAAHTCSQEVIALFNNIGFTEEIVLICR